MDPNDPAASRRYQEYKLPENLTVAHHRAYDYSPHYALLQPQDARPPPPKLFDVPIWVIAQGLEAPIGRKFVRSAGLSGIEKLEAKLATLHRKLVIDIYRGAFGYMVRIPMPNPDTQWGTASLGEGRAAEDARSYATAQATCDELWPPLGDGRPMKTLSWDEVGCPLHALPAPQQCCHLGNPALSLPPLPHALLPSHPLSSSLVVCSRSPREEPPFLLPWPPPHPLALWTHLGFCQIRAWCFHELPLDGLVYEHYRPDLAKYSTRTEHRIAFLCMGTDR